MSATTPTLRKSSHKRICRCGASTRYRVGTARLYVVCCPRCYRDAQDRVREQPGEVLARLDAVAERMRARTGGAA